MFKESKKFIQFPSAFYLLRLQLVEINEMQTLGGKAAGGNALLRKVLLAGNGTQRPLAVFSTQLHTAALFTAIPRDDDA